MTSRSHILSKLKAARQPFANVELPAERRSVVAELVNEDLLTCFMVEAEALACHVATFDETEAAIGHIMSLLNGHNVIAAWDFAHIPLPGLEEAMGKADVEVRSPRKAEIQIGLTGVDVALAATGSIVLLSGLGKGREVSLLPYTHIAVLERSRIVRDLETWLNVQRKNIDKLRQVSKINVISGPSRTADIAMELVMGAHGPAQLYIVVV